MRFLKAVLSAGLVALAAIGVAAPAAAGPAPNTYNWTGFYVGAVGSGGLFTVEQEDYWCWWACDAPTLQDWDASIGLQAGFNGQNGHFVYGIVADINTGFEDSHEISYDSGDSRAVFDSEWEWYATVRGRAGVAVGDVQMFGTAGIAIVDIQDSAIGTSDFGTEGYDCTSTDVDCAHVSETKVGFAGGVGLAYPVSDNVHVTFEYLFIGVPSENDRYDTDEEDDPTDTDDYVQWTTSAHLARIAVVWEFDGM